MTELQDILGQIPVDQLADLLGTDRQSAQAAAEAAVPAPGRHTGLRRRQGASAVEGRRRHRDERSGGLPGGLGISLREPLKPRIEFAGPAEDEDLGRAGGALEFAHDSPFAAE